MRITHPAFRPIGMVGRVRPTNSVSMTMQHSTEQIELFISYSHHDDDLREELCKHLRILQRQGIIASWHDRMIGAGTGWQGQIDEHLNSAQIILLLVSANFMASDYCYDIELTRAIERHDRGEARVIPIILRPVDWKSAPFAKLGVLPKDGKPVTLWSDRDEAFLDVELGIRAATSEIRKARRAAATSGANPLRSEDPARPPASAPGDGMPPLSNADRSGNDTVRRPEPAARVEDSHNWNPHVLEKAKRDLTAIIGPMAEILVPKAAREAQTLPQFYQILAAHIPSVEQRTKFLRTQPC